MQKLSPPEILAAFDPIDRPQVVVPTDTASIAWADLDYLAWRHPGEARSFMVVDLPERPVGLVLRMGISGVGICDLCLSIDREAGTAVAMVTSWPLPRASYGIHVCANLDCSDGARGYKWVYRMSETISVGRRIERLQERVAAFARRVSGLECKTRQAILASIDSE